MTIQESSDTSLKPSELYQVTDLKLNDPYGEKGTYSGTISVSTRLPHGHGRFEYDKAGRSYEGDWEHGRWTGVGALANGDGDFYKGSLKNDYKHGHGIMIFADGRKFEGRYYKGQMLQGKMTFQDGSTYDGQWVDPIRHDGQLVAPMRHGYGRCEFADESIYEGEFVEGEFCGRGKMTWNDGGWYVGEWFNGVMHGFGKEVRANGTLRHDGVWDKGQPVRQTCSPNLTPMFKGIVQQSNDSQDDHHIESHHSALRPARYENPLDPFADLYTSSDDPSNDNDHSDSEISVSSKNSYGSKCSKDSYGSQNSRRPDRFVDDTPDGAVKKKKPTVVSKNKAKKNLEVTDLVITDPYGQKGTYSGSISKPTRRPHGQGRMEYEESGRWYEGEWKNGNWNGFGVLAQANGNLYKGQFKKGRLNGHGFMQYNDGRTFEGRYFNNEMFHGKMTYEDGSTYDGCWVDSMRHGSGRTTYTDSSFYQGVFKEGEFCGNGIFSWNDGGWYDGEWKNGQMHGHGREFRSNGTLRHEGLWDSGKLVRQSNEEQDGHNNVGYQAAPETNISERDQKIAVAMLLGEDAKVSNYERSDDVSILNDDIPHDEPQPKSVESADTLIKNSQRGRINESNETYVPLHNDPVPDDTNATNNSGDANNVGAFAVDGPDARNREDCTDSNDIDSSIIFEVVTQTIDSTTATQSQAYLAQAYLVDRASSYRTTPFVSAIELQSLPQTPGLQQHVVIVGVLVFVAVITIGALALL